MSMLPEDFMNMMTAPELPVEPFVPPQPIEYGELIPRPKPNYLDRLALAFQNLPQFQAESDFMGGVQGFARGFGAARGGDFQRRQMEVDLANKRLSESGRVLAQQRWQNYQASSQHLRSIREAQRAQAQAERDKRRDDLAAARLGLDADRLKELERHNLESEKARTGEGLIDPQEVQFWAEQVDAGTTDLTKVVGYNGRMRTQVVKYMAEHGMKATPPAVRAAAAEMKTARNIITEFGRMSKKVNRATDPAGGRATQAAQNWWAQVSQSGDPDIVNYPDTRKGLASYISRLSGQTGVLSQQDVVFAMSLIPDQYELYGPAQNKIERLNRFLEEKWDAYLTSYTQPGAGEKKVQKWGRDAQGKPVRLK